MHLEHLAYEWLFSIRKKDLYLEWLLLRKNNQDNLCQIDVEHLYIRNYCSQEVSDILYVICICDHAYVTILFQKWVILGTTEHDFCQMYVEQLTYRIV